MVHPVKTYMSPRQIIICVYSLYIPYSIADTGIHRNTQETPVYSVYVCSTAKLHIHHPVVGYMSPSLVTHKSCLLYVVGICRGTKLLGWAVCSGCIVGFWHAACWVSDWVKFGSDWIPIGYFSHTLVQGVRSKWRQTRTATHQNGDRLPWPKPRQTKKATGQNSDGNCLTW